MPGVSPPMRNLNKPQAARLPTGRKETTMSNVPRLISATGSQIQQFSPMDLKQSILKS